MLNLRRKLAQSLLLLSHHHKFDSNTYHTIIFPTIILNQRVNPPKPSIKHAIKPPNFLTFFSSLTCKSTSDSYQHEDDEYNETLVLPEKDYDNDFETNLRLITDIIKLADQNCVSIRNNLEKCGVTVSPELVSEVLSRVRNNWEVAFTFFLWAGEQIGYAHSLRHYHCMIAILGKSRRFDTAWTLIDEMKKGGKNGGESLVNTQTLLIMIRRYSAVHDVDKAINTFYAYKRFGLETGLHEFHDLLSALCRYKNVKAAEDLLMSNKDCYGLSTKSFNIILNGWCNVIGSPREGKRIWWEMCNRGIHRDVISYSCMISCYSKSNESKEVIKIFDEMRLTDIDLDIKIYNGVIHALAKSGHVEKARDLMKLMEEKGIYPNAITYNSLIMPLCKTRKFSYARKVFDEMLQRGLIPTTRTFHAFFGASRNCEEAYSILRKMNKMGCCPSHDTYIMLIKKFCRWGEFENVWKVWNEMIRNGLDPDRSSYVALVNGLFLNGKLEEAYKYHLEMKVKGLLPEPEIEERLERWRLGMQKVDNSKTGSSES
ncbi:pentatricopeptide repeat-containing protein At5g15010, mitochondrial-like [Rutidosis leptorrhynchoides]|uniref:pentatricopeptide repeat-containing protein At5g15010, mitochondrial-like n=1 Tax=Rutidosis leptorrhynchoides TaxID=125765 RepID=UPI003A9914B7